MKTAMVGRQPHIQFGKSYYLRTAISTEIIHAADWHNLITSDWHKTTRDFILANCIGKQVESGIDIISEGECFRQDYWSYFLEFVDGIRPRVDNFSNRKWQIFSPPELKVHFLAEDWKKAQSFTTKPVKITMPGPLTVATEVSRNLVDNREISEKELELLAWQFAKAINTEILDAVQHGCTNIQIDDPQLAFQTKRAKNFAIECMSACFDNIPLTLTKDNKNVPIKKYLHVCRGYTEANTLEKATNKASADCYLEIMPLLLKSSVDIISIENAYHKSPDKLFESIGEKTLMLGSINVNSDKIETVDEIVKATEHVLQFIPKERIILAPDCGCNCGSSAFHTKMLNLAKAAKQF